MNTVTLLSKQQPQDTVTPSKIVCIGRNYIAHAIELNNPPPEQSIIFLKPNSSISKDIYLPIGEEVHYETEICFLIKESQLFAVGLGLDLTKRALQSRLKEKALPWERAKSFNGSAVLSPFIPLEECIPGFSTQTTEQNPFANLKLKMSIDGHIKQQGFCSEMTISPEIFLNEVLTFMHLEDGDILMTGTPAGVGPLQVGHLIEASLYWQEQQILKQDWTAQAA